MTIQYDRAMIQLVKEIRKYADSGDKSQIRLTNPDLLNDLRGIYSSSEEPDLNALIVEFFEKAGENIKPESEPAEEEQAKTSAAKVYRGHKEKELEEGNADSVEKKVKMYRGHKVTE